MRQTESSCGRSSSSIAYSFGPGPFTPAVKALVITNVVAFLLTLIVPEMIYSLGLRPADVLGGRVWQPLTYMFLHGGMSHILFNMLSLWMFGVELERMWGSAFFTRFYLVCGVGAAATTILLSFLARRLGEGLYESLTVGASGAIYGILMAYALYFPNRQIYMYFLFPGAGEVLRDDHRRHLAALGHRRARRRRRARHASRRPGGGLSVSEGTPTTAGRGDCSTGSTAGASTVCASVSTFIAAGKTTANGVRWIH